jgi:hypothetical protein
VVSRAIWRKLMTTATPEIPKSFRRSEFFETLGLLPEKVQNFDLRTIHWYSWCTDTIDGDCNPSNGTWHKEYLATNVDGSVEMLATRYRAYNNGSCEQKGWFGNGQLAQTLEDMMNLYQLLLATIRSVGQGEPGATAQLSFDLNKRATVQEHDKHWLALFLTHHNYLRLIKAVVAEGVVTIEFNADTSTWTCAKALE